MIPGEVNLPEELDARGPHGWDMSNPAICQSEGWRDEMCSEAVALATGSGTDSATQELTMRVIAFRNEATAQALFKGQGTPDEVGPKPPGDQIDGYELPTEGGWTGKGFNARQGSAIIRVEYAWKKGTEVPGRLMDATRVVIERLQQAQNGKNPTASLR
ncbi:hypothetical protein [Streptomyces sp. NPDC093225]|uniref:hypothetical protein n=1 Tax=Streptomyces sp. NPDC093225 TaxID=3366034 RepID=UPI0038217B18